MRAVKLKFVRFTKAFCRKNIDLLLSINRTVTDKRMLWEKKQFFKEGFPLKWKLSYAVYSGDTLCGYLIASKPKSDTAHMHLVIIDKAFRSHGIGSKLIKHLEELANIYNFSKITAWVYSTAKNSLRFYERNGYKIINKRTSKGQRQVLIQKSITEPKKQ